MTTVRVEIDYYPLKLAASTLGVSQTTLRRWAAMLRKANIPELDHKSHETAISAQSMKVYWRFVELRNKKVPVHKIVKDIRTRGV